MLIEKTVRCGSRSTCSTCGGDINKGDLALRRSARAVTYHERLHMDGRGKVHWYHHPKCRTAVRP